MTTQRFCLRWNNHQSNLLSVFDQLLHAETFTDVTLAVEGQYLRAHKMVLSACSPYFQALFTTHPEKHPIVILKDVPYADMKSLLDFMYRGEVSVDQERLTAFLKVAESLRIKGLTEVSDDKNSQLNSSATPPPQLHRIHPYYVQQKKTAMLLTNPVLSNALTMPKRKRGRPRKLSGSSNGTGEYEENESNENIVQGTSELIEVRMGSIEGDENKSMDNEDRNQDSHQEPMDTTETNAASRGNQPVASTSKESPCKDNENSTSDYSVKGGYDDSIESDSDNMPSSFIEPQLVLDEYDEPVEFKYNPDSSTASIPKNSQNQSDDLIMPKLTLIPTQKLLSTTINSSTATATISTTNKPLPKLQKRPKYKQNESMGQELLVPKEEPPEYKSNDTYSSINIVPKTQQSSSSVASTNVEISLSNKIKSPSGIRPKPFLTPQQQQTLSSTFLQHRFHNDTINNNNNNSNTNNSSDGALTTLSNNLITSTPDINNVSIHQNCNNMTSATNVKAETNEAISNSFNNNMLSHVFETQTEVGMSGSSSNSTINTNSANHSGSRPAVRRRIRRKANSMPDDQTEQLTEMSVRGLNLFRYASISEGVYQCTECAKDNIQKTFKNKYSFQRHAFLYHEGTQRKVFPCPVCGKEFSRPDKMKNHMKTTHECYMPRDCTYPLNLLINTSTGTKPTELIKMPKIEFMSTTQ